jgi:hypothetical protein
MTDNVGDSITPETLRRALKAFKKRLKLTRLDDESSLTGGPLGGRRGSIVAIQPPNTYPREVWEELVKQGKLRHSGGGLYELSQEPNSGLPGRPTRPAGW